jgi:hypothetical protein
MHRSFAVVLLVAITGGAATGGAQSVLILET